MSAGSSQPGDLPSAAIACWNATFQQAGGKFIMSAEALLTSDVIGLTKAAPFSRRDFMTASAAVTAGYTLAAGPVRADVIKTGTDGLTAGDAASKKRPRCKIHQGRINYPAVPLLNFI
jgi:hypothetical protein